MRDRRHLVPAVAAVLVAVAGASAQVARGSWSQRAAVADVGHYRIKTDLPPDEANALARHLNLMYEEYARRLASLPPRAPESLNVLIFASRSDYELMLRAEFGIDASGTGGMFFVSPSLTALAFWTGGLAERRVLHVLQHEAFHQFAYTRFGHDLPLWVNEGLAELFGEAVLVDGSFMLGQSTPRVIEAVRESVEAGTSIPFRDMLSMDSRAWNEAVRRGGGRRQYNQSWSMVQFLVYGEGARWQSAFEDYLRLMNRGVRSETAFAQVFGPDVEAFEERWKAYALEARPSAFVTALDRLEFLANGVLDVIVARGASRPATLDELREALQEAQFTYTIDQHGRRDVVDASDPANYRIPMDDLTPEQPEIVLERPPARSRSGRERLLDESSPRPLDIVTRNLAPHDLRVTWIRDMEENTFSYRIDVVR